jgi:hypothetical protein
MQSRFRSSDRCQACGHGNRLYLTSITEPPEHNHTDAGYYVSILWETMLGHSIRDDRSNGFLLPYREMMETQRNTRNSICAASPRFCRGGLLRGILLRNGATFLRCCNQRPPANHKALEIIKECIPGNWSQCIAWTRERFARGLARPWSVPWTWFHAVCCRFFAAARSWQKN